MSSNTDRHHRNAQSATTPSPSQHDKPRALKIGVLLRCEHNGTKKCRNSDKHSYSKRHSDLQGRRDHREGGPAACLPAQHQKALRSPSNSLPAPQPTSDTIQNEINFHLHSKHQNIVNVLDTDSPRKARSTSCSATRQPARPHQERINPQGTHPV